MKRSEGIKFLSKDHHHGLVFINRLRKGVKLDIHIERILAYATWHKNEHLVPHFILEEKHLIPFVKDSESRKRLRYEHGQILKLLGKRPMDFDKILELCSLLESHIRYEEREVFAEIQENSDEKFLQSLKFVSLTSSKNHEWKDKFWNQ